MDKQCPRCKDIFDVEVFGYRAKGGKKSKVVQVYCPECTKAYRREHYRANPDPYKKRARKNARTYEKRNREIVIEYLKFHPCADCGNSDIRVLQFDHVRGKKVLGVRAMKGHTVEMMLKEISKCEVRCANCHIVITGIRGNIWWTKINWLSSSDGESAALITQRSSVRSTPESPLSFVPVAQSVRAPCS